MTNQELVELSEKLSSMAALKLKGDVSDFVKRPEIQLAFHLMCLNAGWDAHNVAMMDTLVKASGLMVGIYLADRQNSLRLEEWPVLPEATGPSDPTG